MLNECKAVLGDPTDKSVSGTYSWTIMTPFYVNVAAGPETDGSWTGRVSIKSPFHNVSEYNLTADKLRDMLTLIREDREQFDRAWPLVIADYPISRCYDDYRKEVVYKYKSERIGNTYATGSAICFKKPTMYNRVVKRLQSTEADYLEKRAAAIQEWEEEQEDLRKRTEMTPYYDALRTVGGYMCRVDRNGSALDVSFTVHTPEQADKLIEFLKTF